MTEVALLQTPERTLMGALQESKGWGLYRNQRMGRGSQGSIHRIRGVLELTLKQNKAVEEGGRVTESARVPWCLRLIVIEVRTPWGAVVVVADWDVCSAVVRDDCVAKLHKPWGVCWVCHLLAHERVPWKRLDRIPECGGGGWQWRRR